MQENKGQSTDFTGTWHIYEMEEWDEDYFNTVVQAYIKIEPDNDGYFQFGLVCGEIDGRIVDYADGKRFEFTFEGNEECGPVSCLLYTSDAADDLLCVDLGGRRIIKKKKK